MNTRTLSPRLVLSSVMLCAFVQSSSPQRAAPAQETMKSVPQAKFTRRRYIEPNMLAPELYSDKLSMKLTLVDLPGASDPRSAWEGTYKLYFISEAEFEKVGRELTRKAREENGGARVAGWNPTPADFPEKILLAEGSISKKNLATPQQRVHLQENIAFKEKIPAELRTKGAHLLSAYSVKVFDAKLKTPVYDSGIFMAFPFDDQTDPDKIAPRTIVYTNFIVTPKGQIWESQLPRKDGDTNWM
ncbi:MAG: hypothetical protein QOE33_1444 [Acidobacteriota bacterium]|nr:hypothetical protein [Acidobacteriota bacterium]